MKKIFFILVLNFLVCSAAHAAGSSLCAGADGSIIARSKCKKGESKVNSQILLSEAVKIKGAAVTGPQGATGIVGSQGEQGPQGPAGTDGPVGIKGINGQLNLNSCRKVSSSGGNFLDAVPSNVVVASANCNTNEFILDDGVKFNAFTAGSGVQAFIQSRQSNTTTQNGMTYEYGVAWTYDRALFGSDGKYFITLSLICCSV